MTRKRAIHIPDPNILDEYPALRYFSPSPEMFSGTPEQQVRRIADSWRMRRAEVEQTRRELTRVCNSNRDYAWELILRFLVAQEEIRARLVLTMFARWQFDVRTAEFTVFADGPTFETLMETAHADDDFLAIVQQWVFCEVVYGEVERQVETLKPQSPAAETQIIIDTVCNCLANTGSLDGFVMHYGATGGQRNRAAIILSGWTEAIPTTTRTAIPRTALHELVLGVSAEAWCDTEETNDPDRYAERVSILLKEEQPHREEVHGRDMSLLPDPLPALRNEEFFALEEARQQHEEIAVADGRDSLPEYLKTVYDDKLAGRPIKQTAANLGCSEGTIKSYRAEIKSRLNEASDDILATR